MYNNTDAELSDWYTMEEDTLRDAFVLFFSNYVKQSNSLYVHACVFSLKR